TVAVTARFFLAHLDDGVQLCELFRPGGPDVICEPHLPGPRAEDSRIPDADTDRTPVRVGREGLLVTARHTPGARGVELVDGAEAHGIRASGQVAPKRRSRFLLRACRTDARRGKKQEAQRREVNLFHPVSPVACELR